MVSRERFRAIRRSEHELSNFQIQIQMPQPRIRFTNLFTKWVCLHETCRGKLPLVVVSVRNHPHRLRPTRISRSYLFQP
jgi:hypothetical protein